MLKRHGKAMIRDPKMLAIILYIIYILKSESYSFWVPFFGSIGGHRTNHLRPHSEDPDPE